jgi:N-acyl-D-aspartate/D-glutamate deacylase
MRQLIRNALIVTGDGETEPYAGDALIEGDRIAALGEVPPGAARGAERELDAAGLALAPGFIDVHNHGALGGTRPGASGLPVACENALQGGVTRRICGVDGLSPAPVAPEQRADYAEQLRPLDGSIGEAWPWSTTAEFQAWHAGRSVTDVGLYVGHSAVRRRVMGTEPRAATESELRAMADVVRAEAPATLGLSTGLIYSPAVFGDRHELTVLLRAFNEVKPGALFPHLRSESDRLLEALQEAIGVAVDAGTPGRPAGYCNEHSKIAGQRNFDKLPRVRALLDDAAANVPTLANMYPYTAGSTTADGMIPPRFRTGTRAEFLARMRDHATRRAIWEWIRGDTTSWDNFAGFCGGLQGIQIAGVRPGVGEAFLGKRLGDVARAAGQADLESLGAHEAVFDFLVANGLDVTIITHYGNDATMEAFFRRPEMAICTDGLMPGPGQQPHPRSIGAFPKALRLARELGIPLRSIVQRMTALPCAFLRLPSPVLRPGADASLVLFDAERVGERNSYEQPLVPPEGIACVWVHGQLVLERGRFHLPRPFPGRILRSEPAA